MESTSFFRNNVVTGIIFGLCIPVLTYGLLFGLNLLLLQSQDMPVSFKQSTVTLLAICANLLPVLIANKRRMEEFIRGIMFPTVLGAFVWFIYFDPMFLFK